MNFTTVEMFAVSRIVNLPKTLGHRTILSGFLKEFQKVPVFNALMEVRENYTQEVSRISEKYRDAKEKLVVELQVFTQKKVSEIPGELKERVQNLQKALQKDVWEGTLEYRKAIEEALSAPETYEVEVTGRMKDIFRAFMEDNTEVSSLKLNERTIELLIGIYHRV